MPKIREYEQQTSAQAAIPGRRAQLSDFGGSGLMSVGSALIGAGEDVQRVNEKLARKKEQDENIEIERQVAAARTQWSEDFVRRQQNAPAGAAGFTEKFKEDFEGYAEKTLGETTLSDRAKARLGVHLETIKAGLIDNAVRFEATSGAAHARESVQTIYDQNVNAVRANPGGIDEVLAQEERLTAGLTTLSAGARETLIRDRRLAIHDAALDGTVDKLQSAQDLASIRAFKKELETNKEGFQATSSPQGYARALDRLTQLEMHFKDKRDRLAMDALKERIQEAGAGVENGLSLSEASFINDAATRAQVEKSIGIANRTGAATRSVAKVSHGDLLTQLQADAEAIQKPGEFTGDTSVARARLQAAQERVKALTDDPVAYAMKHSEPARAAYERMQSENSPEAVRDYVTAMTVEQQRLAPWQAPRLLSADQVGQVKSQMSSVSLDPRGADQVLQNLQELQKQWGKAWPTVYRQLAADKALTDVQIAAARMTDPTKQAAARVLLQTSMTKEADLKKFVDQPGFDRDLQAGVNQALAPMYESMNYQIGGQAQKDRAMEAVKTLALGYIVRGENMSTAVERAAKEVVMDDFQWQGTYYVPHGVDASAVKGGANVVLGDLKKYEFAPPIDLAGLRPGDVKAGAVDALKSGGVWVTNAEGTGIVLTWPNARREMVMVEKDGKRVPFQFTWDELKDIKVEYDNTKRPGLGGPNVFGIYN